MFMHATTYHKAEPLIMQVDCSEINCFQVSPSDFSSSNSSFDDEETDSIQTVYLAKDSAFHTYPQPKPKKRLPRSNSWSFSFSV